MSLIINFVSFLDWTIIHFVISFVSIWIVFSTVVICTIQQTFWNIFKHLTSVTEHWPLFFQFLPFSFTKAFPAHFKFIYFSVLWSLCSLPIRRHGILMQPICSKIKVASNRLFSLRTEEFSSQRTFHWKFFQSHNFLSKNCFSMNFLPRILSQEYSII